MGRDHKVKLAVWFGLLMFCLFTWTLLAILATACTTPPPATVAVLEAAAARRDVGALVGQTILRSEILGDPQPWMLARVLTEKDGCGTGSRPVVWCGRASLGTTLVVNYQPMGYCASQDGDYDFPFAWPVLSLEPPMAAPIALPAGGCPLWLDPAKALVWSFRGRAAYSDALMHRQENGRSILLVTQIPNLQSLIGMKAWTQLVAIDDAQVKTSPVYRVEIGFGRYVQ